jgi:hypothetical protein
MRQNQMTDDKRKGGSPAKAARQARLKQALRENLKRRKAQARERGPGEASPSDPLSNLGEAALDDTGGGEQDG